MIYHDERCALAFSGVNLPSGVIINKAYVTFKFNMRWLSDSLDVWISAASGDTIPEIVGDVEAIERTEARAHWTSSLQGLSQGDQFNSCDISCVLQELVNEGGAESVIVFIEFFTECLDTIDAALVECYSIGDYNQGYSTELHYWYVYLFEEVASGGVVLGGSAAEVNSIVMNGGVLASGQAPLSNFYEPLGGSSVDGEAFTSVTFSPEGGLIVSASEVTSNGVINEPPYDTASTGVFVGGAASSSGIAHRQFQATGGITLEGSYSGGISNIKYAGSGEITVNNVLVPVVTNYRFHKTVDLLWRLRTYVYKDLTFLWNTGQLVMYWYRVVGEVRDYDPCDPKPCCQKVVMNIHARTAAELCEKLSERKFNWKIQSVEKYSQPALLGNAFDDWEDQQQAYEAYHLLYDNCDNPEPVEVCSIPQCANFCIDYDLRVAFNLDISKVSVNGQLEYIAGGDQPSDHLISIGGSANTALVRFDPEFYFESTDCFITLASATEYESSHFASQGGGCLGGTAELAASHWAFVGGEWPSTTGVRTGQVARTADLGLSGSFSAWAVPEDALTIDMDDWMTHGGGADADVDISFRATSEYLVVRGFDLGLPVDASILGIKIWIHRWAEHVGVRDAAIVLVYGDQILSSNVAKPIFRWPLLPTTVDYGSSGLDKETPFQPLDGTWDISVLNSDQFGIAVQISEHDNLEGSLAHLDYLAIEVFYETANHQTLRVSGSGDVAATARSVEVQGGLDLGGAAGVRVTRRYLPTGRGYGQPTSLVFSGTYSTRLAHTPSDTNVVWVDEDDIEQENVGTVAYWASAATSQPRDQIINESVVDSSWSYPQYALVADVSQYAYTNLTSVNVSEFLVVRNFGLNLPEHTKIHGIRVILGNRYTTNAVVRDTHLYLVRGNSVMSCNLANTEQNWDLAATSVIYGSTGFDGSIQFRDVEFDPWKVEEVNDPEFGIALAVWAPPQGPLDPPPEPVAKVDGIAIELTIEVFGRVQTTQAHIQLIGSAVSYPDPYSPTGGLSAGGFAVVKPYWITMEGGVSAGGRHTTRNSYSYEASAEITVTGQGGILQTDLSHMSSGEVTLAGEATCRSSNFEWISDGNILFVQGEANTRGGSIESETVQIGATMELLQLQGVFSEAADSSAALPLTDVVSSCGCLAVPLTIEFSHNLDSNNILAKFLARNGLAMADTFSLYYSVINGSWQANAHYSGLSADANTQERWDFVFEVQCTQEMGGVNVGRDIWKLAISVFRRNLYTLEDFDTRIVVGVLPEAICDTNLNELEFKVDYDTQSDYAAVTPSNATVYQTTLYDNIGLFKNRHWRSYPNLSLSVSQSGNELAQTRIDLYKATVKEDQASIIPSS